MAPGRARALHWILAGIFALPCGCATQQGNGPTSWLSSLIHPGAPSSMTVGQMSRQAPSRAQQWRDVQPEVPRPAEAAAPRQAAVGEHQPAPEPTAAVTLPQPTVTSTMSTATRREAEASINEVDKRLALAGATDPTGKERSQIDMIRKLRDSAQQALTEQDYLTAQSLAQKASILAAHLPGAAGQQPSPSPSH